MGKRTRQRKQARIKQRALALRKRRHAQRPAPVNAEFVANEEYVTRLAPPRVETVKEPDDYDVKASLLFVLTLANVVAWGSFIFELL